MRQVYRTFVYKINSQTHDLVSRWLVLVLVMALAGCQTSNPLQVDSYSSDPRSKLPPVSMFITAPGKELQQICSEAQCSRNNLILSEIYDYLAASDVFHQFVYNNEEVDYGLHVALRQVDTEGVASSTTKALLAASSLMVLPIDIKRHYYAEFYVTWKGIKLSEYRFNTPYSEKLSLFVDPMQDSKHLAESFVSRFIAAAQTEGAFDPDVLYEKLQASNYQTDWQLPGQVIGYQNVGSNLFHHPLAGAQARYARSMQDEQIRDVFVYPIRKTDWAATEPVIQEEMQIALEDIDIAVREGAYTEAAMGPVEGFKVSAKAISGEQEQFHGFKSMGTLQVKDQDRRHTAIYLFVMKDKFVKFRLSSPYQEAEDLSSDYDAFVQALLPGMKVPDESIFMSKLRQEQRKNSLE